MIAIYVAHQYGGDPANRVAAAKWVAFFAGLGYAPIADWIVLTGEWDESMRLRGLEIDKALIERSDVMALVGPDRSHGMLVECDHAKCSGVPRVHLVEVMEEFPATPADMTHEQTLEIVRRINAAVKVRQ